MRDELDDPVDPIFEVYFGSDSENDSDDSENEDQMPNVLGETKVHRTFQSNDRDRITELVDSVMMGRTDITVKTRILSNPFHYAAHIQELIILERIFAIATLELLLESNQLSQSPLSLAIEQDNAAFLQKALQCFPQILDLVPTREGLAARYKTILHDIAKANAVRCFAVVKERCSEYVWSYLNQFRVQEALPMDTAVLAEHPGMYHRFMGHYQNNVPTMAWLAASKLTDVPNEEIPHYIGNVVSDAKADKAYRLATAEKEAMEDNDDTVTEELLGRFLILR